MILIDSSVWISFLNPRISETDSIVESLVRPSNQAVITGIIFQEVLQGIRSEKSFHLVQKLMRRLPFLEPDQKTYLKAAQVFRALATRGRSGTTVDVLIAALAIQYNARLFTLDRGFQVISEHTDLKLFIF